MKSLARFVLRSSAIAVAASLTLGSVGALAAEVDGPAVNWKLSTWGKQRAFTAGMEELAKQLDEKTGGKFKIKIFYGEALSKAKENLDGIKLGAFEMAMFCNFYHPGKNPANMVFTLPFLDLGDFRVSRDVRNAIYEMPASVKEMDQWDAMLYVSSLLPQYEFMGRGKAPKSPADFSGLRVRAGGGVGKAMEKLGATLTTVPATEVYTGMERGTIDAASFPYTYAHASYKLPEVSNWFTGNLSPGTSDCPVVIGKKAYAKLPDQYKKLLMDMKPRIDEVQIQAYVDIDKKNLPAFKKKLEEVRFTKEQLAEFQKTAGEPVWNEWIAENQDKFDAKGLVAAVQAEIAKAKQKYNLE
ncbi:MAG: TRAP transporter substrate-binding protein DctP [Burkholderiaceae bacterium]